MSRQPSPSLVDVLDTLLEHHIDIEEAYYGEMHRRTDAYKKYLETRKKKLAKNRSQLKAEVENERGEKELREPSDSDLGGVAYREAEKWIEQNRDERSLSLPRENTPFQHAVQVLIGDHHLTIVDDSGDWDVDGDNPAEEQVRRLLGNRRLAKRGRGELTGTTALECELKRLDTPVVVQSVLRKVWAEYPEDCAAMGLPRPDLAAEFSEAKHSTDYRSVLWHGTQYSFTAKQAACIKLLWEAWEQGTPDVGEATILEAADCDCVRLSDLYGRGNNRHPAWGTIIQAGATKGTYRLAEPEI